MLCHDTGDVQAVKGVHVPTGALELAIALAPYIDIVQETSQGNGDIIIPLRSGAIDTIRLDLRGKLRKIIRFARKER